jgi:hypothetical protein
MLRQIFTRENLLALAVFVMLLALVVFLRGATPTFIYQGF